MNGQSSDTIQTRALLDIIKVIDTICEEHQLQYFAYADLLIGCVHYQNFIPNVNPKNIEVGLMRSEYEQLIPILRKNAEHYGLIWKEFYDDSTVKCPMVQLGKQVSYEKEGAQITDIFWVNIGVFDVASREFDFRDAYYDRMDRANATYDRIVVGHGYNTAGQKTLALFLKKLLYGWRNPDKAFEKLNQKAAKYQNEENMTAVRKVIPSRGKQTFLDQLFPLQRLPFCDMMLPCPKDYSPWTVLPDENLMNQIQTIQKVDLVLLKEFDRVCRLLDIGYFICGGTMLGYARHGGFIPWDDDIDVGMLREDYDRFLEEGGKYLDERFFLQTRQSDPKIPYLFSKIRMHHTEYITTYNDRRDFHKGICLDLFPFDAIPEEHDAQIRFYNKVNKLSSLHNRFCNRSIPEPICHEEPKCFEDWYYRKKGKLRRFLYKLMPLKFTQWLYIRKATQYNKKAKELGLSYVASFVPSYTFIKREDLLPYRDVSFEGLTVKVPNKPEVFLTMQYGDYMQMPPLHKRVGHDLIRWSANVDLEEES